MLEEAAGNLLDAPVDAVVNTVNTVGVMGKGIALQFKQAYPENFRAYEAACRRGNDIGATTYGSIASILKNGLDRAYAKHAGEAANDAAFHHDNIRGRDYYH